MSLANKVSFFESDMIQPHSDERKICVQNFKLIRTILSFLYIHISAIIICNYYFIFNVCDSP